MQKRSHTPPSKATRLLITEEQPSVNIAIGNIQGNDIQQLSALNNQKKQIPVKYNYTPHHKRSHSVVTFDRMISTINTLIKDSEYKVQTLQETNNLYSVPGASSIPDIKNLLGFWSNFLQEHKQRTDSTLEYSTDHNMHNNIIEDEEPLINNILNQLTQFNTNVLHVVKKQFPYQPKTSNIKTSVELNPKENAELAMKIQESLNIGFGDAGINLIDTSKIILHADIHNSEQNTKERVNEALLLQTTSIKLLETIKHGMEEYKKKLIHLNKEYDSKQKSYGFYV